MRNIFSIVFVIVSAFSGSCFSQQDLLLDPRQQKHINLIKKELGIELERSEDGIFVSKDLNKGFLSPSFKSQKKVFEAISNDCMVMTTGLEKYYSTTIYNSLPSFNIKGRSGSDGENVKSLEGFLLDKSVVSKAVSSDVAQIILFQPVGFFEFLDKGRLKGSLMKSTGISSFGRVGELDPSVCLVTEKSWKYNVVYSVGLFGTPGKNDVYIYYAPASFFAQENIDRLNKFGRNGFVEENKAALRKRAEKMEEVVEYRLVNSDSVVGHASFVPGARDWTLNIGFSNKTNKPFIFPLKSIGAIGIGSVDYMIAYKEFNGRVYYNVDELSCSSVNNDSQIIINPNQSCQVSISNILVSGVDNEKLPRESVSINILNKKYRFVPATRNDIAK